MKKIIRSLVTGGMRKNTRSYEEEKTPRMRSPPQ
jgi:hypothetical protein